MAKKRSGRNMRPTARPRANQPTNAAAEIQEFMAAYRLDDLVIERGREKIEVRSGNPSFYAPVSPRGAPAAQSSEAAPPAASAYTPIRAPMAGTFYRSASPNTAAYVNVGDRVTPDATVCIIEAMKVMNEIKAETSGRVVKICAENAASIESGSLLFEIDPAG